MLNDGKLEEFEVKNFFCLNSFLPELWKISSVVLFSFARAWSYGRLVGIALVMNCTPSLRIRYVVTCSFALKWGRTQKEINAIGSDLLF